MLRDQPDESSRRAMGRAYSQLGGLLETIGTKEDTLAAYRQAVAVQRELALRPRADEEDVLDCLGNLFSTADSLWRMGRYDEAAASAKEGFRLAQPPPDSRDRRMYQAKMCNVIAMTEALTNRLSEALSSFRRNLARIEDELKRLPPADQADASRPRIPIWDIRLGEFGTWDSIGGRLESMGNLPEALACRLKARDLIKELAKGHPENTTLLRYLAGSHFQVGREYQANRRPEEALAAFRDAEVVWKRMLESAPNDLDIQRDLSAAQFHMSGLHIALGRREQGLALLEEGIRRSRAVAQADPSNVYMSQNGFVQYLHFYASLLEEMGRPKEALAHYEEARAIIDRVLREVNPDEPVFRGHREWNTFRIGQLHVKTAGRLDAARVALDQVIATWEGLTRNFPADPYYRLQLGYSLALRGLARARSGRPAEAGQDRRRAIAILDGLTTRTSDDLYMLACTRALLGASASVPGPGMSAAEARSELDLAMTSLRAAVAAGFRDLAHIRADDDLATLRPRPDFQFLLLDLAMPDDPFAPCPADEAPRAATPEALR